MYIIEDKSCQECKKFKTFKEFANGGLSNICKKCKNKKKKNYYIKGKYKSNYIKKNKISKHPGKSGSKEYARSVALLSNYGITLQDYNNMFMEQEGSCWICGISQLELDKPLSVDHDHTTGKVRGLLCNNHNVALGLFKDNIELLEKAIKYLKKNK